MHRSRVIAFLIGAAFLGAAAIAEAVTWWSGTVLATTELEPAGDVWVGTMSGVSIPERTPVVLDLVSDYQFQGDVTYALDGTFTSASGERARVTTNGRNDEGGLEIAEHDRSEPFMTRTAGTWSGQLVLRGQGNLQFRAATATLRAGVMDLDWLAVLLAVPGLLAFLAGLASARIGGSQSDV